MSDTSKTFSNLLRQCLEKQQMRPRRKDNQELNDVSFINNLKIFKRKKKNKEK